jgi:hypothetical protein
MVFWVTLSALAMIASLYFNWSHWGNLALVNDDIHREFVTPLRLLKGEFLYKDFNFVYPPLSPYINSLFIRIPFLEPFTILRFVALGLFFSNLLFLWLICRDIELLWIFGPVLFGIVSWTNSYTLNPTQFSSGYAALFSTFGTWCAIRTSKGEKWSWVGLGIAFAVVLLTKPEGVFVIGLASIGAYVLNARLQKRPLYGQGLYWLIGFISLIAIFALFLFPQGLSLENIIEGILQNRFQTNMSMGFIEQYGYFFGINHVIVIIAGCVFIALIFYMVNLYQTHQRFIFWSVSSISVIIIFVFVYTGQLVRITDDYQNLGDLFGGILGYWWYRQIPEGILKKGFFIFWFSSLGGWLRPLFHVGALVVPFRVGGGMLLAAVFWLLILPSLSLRIYPYLIKDYQWLTKVFIKIGCIGILVFGFTGLQKNYDYQWKYPSVKFETKYGSFFANSNEQSTQLGIEVINWIKNNISKNKRIVALEGLPIELVLGWLPCIPLSQLNYQIYEGDTQRIISVFDTRQDIEYIIVHVKPGGYNFGIQDYKLADYLDTKWKQVKRFNVPDQLTSLTQMSPDRKRDSGLVKGFILYGQKY